MLFIRGWRQLSNLRLQERVPEGDQYEQRGLSHLYAIITTTTTTNGNSNSNSTSTSNSNSHSNTTNDTPNSNEATVSFHNFKSQISN